MKEFFKKYAVWIIATVVVIILFAVFYYIGKQKGGGYTVVDDSGNPVNLTDQQKQEASALSKEIYDDLNSGLVFGMNFFSSIGRNTACYQKLASLSDTMFQATCGAYYDAYKTSLIADLRAESSLPQGEGYMAVIYEKANRLKIA